MLLRSEINLYEEAEINSLKLEKLLKVNYEKFVDSIECGPVCLNNFQGTLDTTSRYIVYWNPSVPDSMIAMNKGNLGKHIVLNMETKNSKFLHVSNNE